MKHHSLLIIRSVFVFLLFSGIIPTTFLKAQRCDVRVSLDISEPVYEFIDCYTEPTLVENGKVSFTLSDLPQGVQSVDVSVGNMSISQLGEHGVLDLGTGSYSFDVVVVGYGSRHHEGTFEGTFKGNNYPDYDGDGIPNCFDIDSDGDGVGYYIDPDDEDEQTPPGENPETQGSKEGFTNKRMSSARLSTVQTSKGTFYDIGILSMYNEAEDEIYSGPYCRCSDAEGNWYWAEADMSPDQLGVNAVAYDPATRDGILVGDFHDFLYFFDFIEETKDIKYNDSYIIRVSRDKETRWTSHMSSNRSTSIKQVEILPDGNLLVSGTYVGDMEYRGQVYPSKGSSLSNHAFLMKLTSSGEVIWMQSVVSSWSGYIVAIHDDHIILGYLSKQAPATLATEKYTSIRQILMKVDLNTGTQLAWGAQPYSSYSNNHVVSTHKGQHDYYLTTQTRDVANDKLYVQIAHYDANLQHTWTKNIFAVDESDLTFRVKGMVIDDNGNIMLTTSFQNTLWVQSSEDAPLHAKYTSLGQQDILLMTLDPDGNYLSSEVYGDEGMDMTLSLERNADNAMMVTGCYSGNLQMQGDQLVEAPNNYIPFFKVLDQQGLDQVQNQRGQNNGIQAEGDPLLLYPNPNDQGTVWLAYDFEPAIQYRIQLQNMQGVVLKQWQIHGQDKENLVLDIPGLKTGSYVITVLHGNTTDSQTLIVE